MRAALIKDGVVQNVIEVADDWDKTEWDGHQVVLTDEAEVEDSYDGGRFTRPVRPVPPPPEKSRIELLEERVTALEAKVR